MTAEKLKQVQTTIKEAVEKDFFKDTLWERIIGKDGRFTGFRGSSSIPEGTKFPEKPDFDSPEADNRSKGKPSSGKVKKD